MLRVKKISFGYGNSPTVDSISFCVKKGDVLAIAGESGSGKSTILKLIYGELDLGAGSISWEGQNILGPQNKLIVGPEFMKYVSQEFELMTFTTVSESVGSHLSAFFPKKRSERTQELLEIVGLSEYKNRKVKLLSGGQKQRVSLAKALAKEPEILLLDEPFGHIDSFKKRVLRKQLFDYLKIKNISCVVATHDKEDVLAFADKMLFINNGKSLAYGRPKELFSNPEHSFVAAFFSEYSKIDNVIYYSHDIKIVPKSKLRAVVVKSYYKGSYFLIEAVHCSKTVFLEHPEWVRPDSEINIEFKMKA